jgi:hypothetical protein
MITDSAYYSRNGLKWVDQLQSLASQIVVKALGFERTQLFRLFRRQFQQASHSMEITIGFDKANFRHQSDRIHEVLKRNE